MVERAPELGQLNYVTDSLNYLNEQQSNHTLSNHAESAFRELLSVVKNFNETNPYQNPKFWENKNLSIASIEEAIRQAEQAVVLFRKMFPNDQRSVEERMRFILFTFWKQKEIDKLERNLKNLKERWQKYYAKVQNADGKQFNK